MVDDPSVEDQGGFEFGSGIDIFSEPGVAKASLALSDVTFGVGAAPAAVPTWADDIGGSTNRMYVVSGDKLLESTDGSTFNLFLTDTEGDILGLKVFDSHVYYAADDQLGRAPVGNAAGKDDTYAAIEDDNEYHPMDLQAGGLKIGAGRYVANVAEGGTVTAEALKLPVGYRVKSLASHLQNIYAGTKFGPGQAGSTTFADASAFDWNGILLSAGSALPRTHFPLKMRGMHALLSDGSNLFGWPESARNVHIFDGVTFRKFRRLFSQAFNSGEVNAGAVCQHGDTILWGNTATLGAGVFQMKDGAICQAFVPAGATPGSSATYTIGFVRSAFNGQVFVGYFQNSDTSYHIAKTGSNRQNNAVVQTLWHRMGTDGFKRWAGIRLNLKPLAANTAVTVSYRTDRDASFTPAPHNITSVNQNRPVMFTVRPRSKEIQFRFVFTTATSNTPELISYDPIFETLASTR